MLRTPLLRPFSLRLGGRLQILLAGSFLVTLVVVLGFQTIQRVVDTAAQRQMANLHIAQVMAGPLSSALPISDPAAIYGYMEILEKNPTAAAVVIVKAGEVIKSQQSLQYIQMPLDVLKTAALAAFASRRDKVIDQADFEFIGVPVLDSAERVIGALGIAWSTRDLYGRIWRDALGEAGAIGLACITLFCLLGRAVRNLVTRPLRTIADMIEHNGGSGQRDQKRRMLGYQARADEIGTLARALGSFQQRAAEVERLNIHFDAALANMTQGLCLFDAQQRLLVHNQCFAKMFGEPGRRATASTLSADLHLSELFQPPTQGKDNQPDEHMHELPDGRMIQVLRQAIAGEGWVATYEDVTERHRSRERLLHMARHDALTGLPNRVTFREHMAGVLHRVRRGDSAAVLYLDLDAFRSINDTLGHAVGDELLCTVAGRLRACTRQSDLVTRLGSDEFAIIQAGVDQPVGATTLADRLLAALRMPFLIHEHRIVIGASIGIAVVEDRASGADVLLRSADIALDRAKAAGRGKWCLFERAMDIEMQTRRTLELDLRRALAEEQFEVHYQPLIEARNLRLIGFEALIRWRHPHRGLVSPAEFIPLAEEVGLIKPMGAWVLTRACTDAAAWPAKLKIAVNLSPAQFSSGDLVQEVERALAMSGLAASRLELEITESVLLQDNDATIGMLRRLHKLGARISMDDFGTGYSSLSYLRRFPFDKIKVDQSFVRSLLGDKGSLEIVRSVVGLGKALGMNVLAEGVETAEQLAILQTEGCDELQGYLFGKPLPLRDAQRVIEAHNAADNNAADNVLSPSPPQSIAAKLPEAGGTALPVHPAG